MSWFPQDTQIQLLGWMEKCFIHPQIWDEMMERGIYILKYREKKKPIQILVLMDGNVVVSQAPIQIELLGGRKNLSFIHKFGMK